MKVIFLDFDGVLNSTAWHTKKHEARLRGEPEQPWPQGHIDPDAVAVLNEIYAKTDAVFVVSSTWRIGQKRTWLQDQLNAKGFKGIVLGMTPVLDTKRGLEIQRWIDELNDPLGKSYRRRLGDLTHFVILDDDTDMEHLYDKLVHIDYATGLTRDHLPLILEHLGV